MKNLSLPRTIGLPKACFIGLFLAVIGSGLIPDAFAQESESDRFFEAGDAQFEQETQHLEQDSEQPGADSLLTTNENSEAPEPVGTSADASPSSNSSYPWTAEDLAQAAYEGHLKDEGIPGHQTLANECRGGFTTARDVLRASVKAGMMPSRVMDDAGYLEQLRLSFSEATDETCS